MQQEDVYNLSVDDIQELKDNFKSLDKKIDKGEDRLNKYMESTSKVINKMSEAIADMKLMMAKDYLEKVDLEKFENATIVRFEKMETMTTDKFSKIEGEIAGIKDSQIKCQIKCETKEKVEDKIEDKQDRKETQFKLSMANYIQIGVVVTAIVAVGATVVIAIVK